MTKTDLIKAAAEKAGMTQKDMEKALEATLTAVEEAVAAGEKVSIFGFGTFELKTREARTGRNPQTGAEIQIAASKNVGFKAAKALKDALNK